MASQHKIGTHRTTVSTNNGTTQVVYHSTPVVVWDKNKNTVQLNSGGWETNTTKRRINQVSNEFGLKYNVFKKKFDWYVSLPNGEVIAFFDGMEFDV